MSISSGKIVMSGMQPSGMMHLGNYIGAILNWKDLLLKKRIHEAPDAINHKITMGKVNLNEEKNQFVGKFYCMIADLHSLTSVGVEQNKEKLMLDLVSCYLACGLDPHFDDRICIYQQSSIPNHALLAWIFNCITPLGLMERMTQFKDKKQNKAEVNLGLLSYPVLQAADILLYLADIVPVGADQKQHLELTQIIAQKFNNLYGEVFKVPETFIGKNGARIMSLADGRKKMSKSDPNIKSCIFLNDSDEDIKLKIKRAATDSILGISFDPESRPEISNLLTIFHFMSYGNADENGIASLAEKYHDTINQKFKADLTDAIIEHIAPIREKITYYRSNLDYVKDVIKKGSELAKLQSHQTMQMAMKLIGI